MDKLQLPHAKLLYFVSELWKSNELQNNEKLQLKEMIISDEPKVFKILDNYEATQNMYQLKNDIINLVRQPSAQSAFNQLNVEQPKPQQAEQTQVVAQPQQQQVAAGKSKGVEKNQIQLQQQQQQHQQQQQQEQRPLINIVEQQPVVVNGNQDNQEFDQAEIENIEDAQDYEDIVNQAQLNDPSSPLGNYLINIKKAKPTGIKAIKDVLRPIKNGTNQN